MPPMQPFQGWLRKNLDIKRKEYVRVKGAIHKNSPHAWMGRGRRRGQIESKQRLSTILCCLMTHIEGTEDASLFLTYYNFIETLFNKVFINVNISNTYKVFYQPKMSIIPKCLFYQATASNRKQGDR